MALCVVPQLPITLSGCSISETKEIILLDFENHSTKILYEREECRNPLMVVPFGLQSRWKHEIAVGIDSKGMMWG